MVAPTIANFEESALPCFSFLIKHSSGRQLLFDLGVRKDWENSAAGLVSRIKDAKWGVKVEKDVATILEENSIPSKDIEAIVWSHCKLSLRCFLRQD